MSTERLSLAQQLAQLDQPTPVDYDPDDLAVHGPESDGGGRTASLAGREHYFEVGPSSLRKLHDSISDIKYEGIKASRKKLLEIEDDEQDDEGEDEEGEDEEGEDGEGEGEDGEGEGEDGEGEGEDGEGEGEDGEGEEGEDEGEEESEGEEGVVKKKELLDGEAPSKTNEEDEESDSESGKKDNEHRRKPLSPTTRQKPQPEFQATDNLTTTLQKTREEDLKKGKAVIRQMNLWDSLLDARIRLQKSVAIVNKITLSTSWSPLAATTCQEDLDKYLEESMLMTEDLFELEETLLSTNDVATPPPRKRRRIQEDDDPESYAAYVTGASMSNAKLEQAVHPWLVQTLAKWSAKIQAVTPSVLLTSNRDAFSKQSNNIKSAVQLVDETLLSHPRLLAKTQISRGKARSEQVDGKEACEMFDDTDFYQQLLRDVIESRGHGVDGLEDWMALQREKKAKKKVDTRASKGRKLRYEMHEKLQNFMVPVPIVGAWHEEQVDELFASLLGKGVESAVDGEISVPETERTFSEAIRNGFRVFG